MNGDKEKNPQSDNESMRVVLDTNVLVSALIKPGKPRDLLNKLVKDKQLILCKAIIEEFIEVAENRKVARYTSEEDLTLFITIVAKASKIVKVKSKFRAVNNDPDDDVIVQVAYDGKADFIVSGDKHLLALGEFKGIKILTIDEMLDVLRG